jgi:hypothetical protein
VNDEPKSTQAASGNRRWSQFGLRGLLLLVLAIAIGLLACRQYLKPYWRQQQTIALIERLGGTCQTAEAGQWWLRLAGSTHNVTQVNLADSDDPDAYLADVAELPAVELLIVGGPEFTDEHARRLYKTHSLRGLIHDSTGVTDEELTALRAALSNAEVYASQRRTIAWFKKRDSIAFLPQLATSSLRRLAGDEWFREAEDFHATRQRFGDSDVAKLRPLRQLALIALRDTQVTDAGLQNLRGMSHLLRLDLGNTEVTDAGLDYLRGLAQLQLMKLDGTKVTGAGFATLGDVGRVPGLSIDVSDTQLDDAGLAQLGKLDQTVRIDMARTAITDAGLEHLKSLKQLQWLNVIDCRITDAGLVHLKDFKPATDYPDP